MMAPAVRGLHAPVRCILDNWPGSAMKYVPSIPKPTLSTEPSPSMSDDPACEKPTLSSCLVSGTSSKIRTSKRKRPETKQELRVGFSQAGSSLMLGDGSVESVGFGMDSAQVQR